MGMWSGYHGVYMVMAGISLVLRYMKVGDKWEWGEVGMRVLQYGEVEVVLE